MSSSSTPAPHPKSPERPPASAPPTPVNTQPASPPPPVPLEAASRPLETITAAPEPGRAQRSETCQTEPVALPSLPEMSPSPIDTDVRRHGLNPFLTGVTVGIIAFIVGFLICFTYLVVYYLRYTAG